VITINLREPQIITNMTNKLPEIGKRYRAKVSTDFSVIYIMKINNPIAVVRIGEHDDFYIPVYNFFQNFEELPEENTTNSQETKQENFKPSCGYCGGSGEMVLTSYPPQFQPCPKYKQENPNLQEKPEVQYFKRIYSEIEKAKEELKVWLRDSNVDLVDKNSDVWEVFKKAQNLIDALEVEGSQPQDLGRILKDQFDKGFETGYSVSENKRKLDDLYKSQSIWKPMSELPTEPKLIVARERLDKASKNLIKEWRYYEEWEQIKDQEAIKKMGEEIKVNKSIWKPVSEVPFGKLRMEPEILIRNHKGQQTTLGDFLDDVEQTKLDYEERLRKAEKMISSLINLVLPKTKLSEADIKWAKSKLEGK